ncbi:hypothetical protein [Microbacterium sp. NPDC087665]|uniref:hypothetical protein n=1 Tax=Microbacterium sp. NPDC087665 TaxID=3364194 RepID=UPI0038028823
MFGPPRAVSLAFAEPAPLIAYAVPFSIAWIVVGAPLMTLLAPELVIVNGAVSALGTSTTQLTAIAIGTVVIAIAHGFALTAATLAIAARVDGRPLCARDAWATALRRPGSVALATIVSLAGAAIGLVIAVFIGVQPIAGIAAAIALGIGGIVLAPLLLAWPLVVVRRQSLGSALAAAWRSPREFQGQGAEPLGSPRFAVVFTVIATGIIVVVIRLLGALVPLGWWTPVVGVALVLVPTALVQVLLAAVAVRGAALRVKGPLDVTVEGAAAEASDSAVSEPAESRSARAPRGGALAGIAVLLVPALAAGAVLAVNPWHVPAYDAADLPRVWRSSQIVPWQNGAVLLSRLGGEDASASLCDGATCGPAHDMRTILPTAVAPADDGGMLSASWYPVEGADSSSGSFELRVTHSTPDALAHWSDPRDEDAPDEEPGDWAGFPGEERVLGSVDSAFERGDSVFARMHESRMAVAIDTSGPAPVIASVIGPRGTDATLAIDFCADSACTDSTRTTQELEWAIGLSNATTIDIVSTDDGDSAVVTLTQKESDGYGAPLRVFTATADGDWTTETLDADVPGPVAEDDGDFAFGAQVERGADGMPVILFRAADRSGLRLFSCADIACAEGEITDITPETDLLAAPALAIDESGRPLIGTFDRAQNIALISCDDAACTDRTLVPIAAVAPTEAGFSNGYALSVDDEGRPLIAVGMRRAGSTAKATFNGTVFNCIAARCGAN